MKFKKFISKSLMMAVLLNSCLTSLASAVSEDGRYETFEGNNINIDNILEKDKVDIEVFGNTVVNILDYEELSVDSIWKYSDGTGSMELSDEINRFKTISHNLNKDIELNKEYTMYINITKNTMSKGAESSGVAKIALCHDYNLDVVLFINSGQTGVIKHVFRPSNKLHDKAYISVLPHSYNGVFEFKDFMIVEGNHVNEDISFFKGLKSVGQNDTKEHILEVISQSNNLFDGKLESGTISGSNGGKDDSYTLETRSVNFIKALPNTNYTITSYSDTLSGSNNNYGQYIIYEWDKNKNYLGFIPLKNINSFTTKNETKYIKFRVVDTNLTARIELLEKPNKIRLLLNEPLRGLPNGITDKIIKRNGQWVIERNCGEILLDGTESWYLYYGENELQDYPVFYTCMNNIALNHSILCDKIPVLKLIGGETGKFAVGSHNTVNSIRVCIELSKLSSRSASSFKEWLQTNPIKVVYQLAEPIYEPLNIDSTLDLYLDTTYISNNSIIPANMKITIDRTINRATEMIELAKTNPTVENLSQARYWINLMKDSLNKDNLQNQIDNITEIEDLTIEPKKASSSLDIYVKSKNSLTMTLSTNSIIFDGFTGVDDMEKLNAVNITVNSSLPYQLNSYMTTELQNKDNTKVIPRELFNIRLNGESDYKAFSDINEKLVLKDDCEKGNNNNFNIDLILKGSLTNKADVYKTTIKFEAEQK